MFLVLSVANYMPEVGWYCNAKAALGLYQPLAENHGLEIIKLLQIAIKPIQNATYP
jgi:hypothetical protein